jgi:hypothetical protein
MPTPAANSVPLTTYPLVDGLVQGGSWLFDSSPPTLSYAFNINTATDAGGNAVGGTWDAAAAIAAAVEGAFAAWSSVASLSFVSLGAGGAYNESSADIAVTLTADTLSQALDIVARAYFPDPALANAVREAGAGQGASYPGPEGDIFLDNFAAAFANVDPGGIGFTFILRAIGHALGLKTTSDDGSNARPTFSELGIAQLDTAAYTLMSAEAVAGGDPVTGNIATPMPLDILAIQRIYGANSTFASGDNVYAVANDGIWRTLWDSGGVDVLDASALSAASGATLDLRQGAISSHGSTSRTAIAYNVTIENAIGSAAGDSIQGNDAANTLTGGGGDDTLGGGGDTDTARYAGASSEYLYVSHLGTLRIADRIAARDGVDQLIDIEQVFFTGDARTLSTVAVDRFTALEYIASYTDLMNGFSANAELGYSHFVQTGRFEGREASFRGLDYIASYADLIGGFGADGDLGAAHFINSGRFEGRSVTFNALEYIATYADLIVGFGANATLGGAHFIGSGRFEGRAEDFDAAQYLANYADLQAGYGGNLHLATIHYIQSGFYEGRTDQA